VWREQINLLEIT